MDTVVVIATFTAQEGQSDALKTSLLEMIAPTRAEPGCLRYSMTVDTKNHHIYTMIERFKDQNAFEKHGETPHVAKLKAKLPELVTPDGIQVSVYKEVA